MTKKIISLALMGSWLAICSPALGQRVKPFRIGVITAGGAWYATIDGLREGLKQLGLEDGKQVLLEIRDTKGNVKTAERTAKALEEEGVNLIYTTQTSISIAAKRATAHIPVVFCAGADPVSLGLVDSWAKPGEDLPAFMNRALT